MESHNWKKTENEAGYPIFINNETGKLHNNHPDFQIIIKSIEEYDGIKYTLYRTAFKIFALQTQLKVPPLRISSGVFARHQLSLSESSLSLDSAELESVLGDIYFAAEKEGHFSGDVDLAVDLLINLLLNVYDRDRKEPIRVLAAKTLLICLSTDPVHDKWGALSNCCADHNGCVSQKRLASLLTHVTALTQFLGSSSDSLQIDVDSCFAKSAGMLGVSSRSVAEWGATDCKSTQWLPVVQRVAFSRESADVSTNCACCALPIAQMLKFQCTKCSEKYFCEKCYLYDKNLTTVSGHKKNHIIHEIVDGQPKPPECLSFIKGMKRFFFCTKTKKRKVSKSTKTNTNKDTGLVKRRKDGKPAIFTSTVGKASGNKENNPVSILHDIISQLEAQNKALQEEAVKSNDESLKTKVEAHWTLISAQISRLKTLKDNLSTSQPNSQTESTKPDKNDRPQAFDLFSPIPIEDEKQSKVNDNIKNQPRVLSLDSGNFSVVSKNASQNLLTVSGDGLKPVAVHSTSDTISTLNVHDISSWYNGVDKQIPSQSKPADLSASEQKFAEDIRSVQTSNDKMREVNADLDTVLDRLHQILANNFAIDESNLDNTQLRETANEMEGLLETFLRGVEHRATVNSTQGLV